MIKPDIPVTTAVRVLRDKEINFIPHFYNYEDHGGTRVSSELLNVPEYQIIKTIILQTDIGKPLIVLMHGNKEISTKQLARTLGVKHIEPSDEKTAHKYTGYIFGGTSPFGTKTKLPVYVEKSIYSLEKIFINGGKRGFLVEITPKDLSKALEVTEVEVAIDIGI